MSMVILVPTRGRPENAQRLQERFYQSIKSPDTHILFCADDDDPEWPEYDARLGGDVVKGPRLRLGGTLNHYAVQLAEDFDIVGFVGDDVYPRTPGWDGAIESAMRLNGIVYTNDGWQGENLPTAVFMDSRVIKKLGYMVLPGMTHLFIDNYWFELGTRLDTLTYLPHVYLEHLHPFAGKAEMDTVYEEANDSKVWSEDEATLNLHIKVGAMDAAVKRILD